MMLLTALAIRSGIPVSVWETEDPLILDCAINMLLEASNG